MKPSFPKLGLLLYLWYEVSAELHMTGGATLAFTLLACAIGMMHPKLSEPMLALPRILLLAAPAAVWFGLAWWLTPTVVSGYPVLALGLAALLALAGGAARYVLARYPLRCAPWQPMLRGAVTPSAAILVAGAGRPDAMLGVAVLIMLIALPAALGWRMIGAALAAAPNP